MNLRDSFQRMQGLTGWLRDFSLPKVQFGSLNSGTYCLAIFLPAASRISLRISSGIVEYTLAAKRVASDRADELIVQRAGGRRLLFGRDAIADDRDHRSGSCVGGDTHGE